MRPYVVVVAVLLGCGERSPDPSPVEEDASADSPDVGDAEWAIDTREEVRETDESPPPVYPECPPGPFYIRVNEPGGVVDEFKHFCLGHSAYTDNDIPLAYRLHKGANGGNYHAACDKHDVSAFPRKALIVLDGSVSGGGVSVQLPDGRNARTSDFKVSFTRSEPIGGVVEGTFEATFRVETDSIPSTFETIPVAGSFRLCHGEDSYAPD